MSAVPTKPKAKVVLNRGSKLLSEADAKLSHEIAEELWGLSTVNSDDKSITYETDQLNSEYDTDRFWGCVRLACAGITIALPDGMEIKYPAGQKRKS